MGHCSARGTTPRQQGASGARGKHADRDNPQVGAVGVAPPIAPGPSHFLRSLINYLQALLAGPLRRARRKGLMWRHDQRPTACASVRWPVGRRFRTDPALLRRARLVMATRQNPRGSRHYDEVQVARVLAHQRAPGAARLHLLEISTILQAQDRIDELRGELASTTMRPVGARYFKRVARLAPSPRRCAGKLARVAEFLGQVDETDGGHLGPTLGPGRDEAAASPRIAAASVGPSFATLGPNGGRFRSGRRERRVVEAMGLGNRLTGDGTPTTLTPSARAGSSSTAWRQPPAAMASV